MPTGTKGNYEVRYGKPPRNAGFKKSDDVIERRAERAGDDHRERPAPRDRQARGGDQIVVNKFASARAGSSAIAHRRVLNLEAQARSSAALPPAVGPADEEVPAQLEARLEVPSGMRLQPRSNASEVP